MGLGGTVVPSDVDRYLESSEGVFDLAFVDPPYALPLPSLLETMKKLSPRLAQTGIAVVHRRHGEDPPEFIESLVLIERRRYGGAELWRYQKEQT